MTVYLAYTIFVKKNFDEINIFYKSYPYST